MSPKDDKAYLTHILESIATLSRHLRRTPENMVWHEDELVRDAVLRVLQTMGESCQKLSPQGKAMAAEIEWKAIANFRHVLVHDYMGEIDYAKVSAIIENHLPLLQAAVARLYETLYG